MPDAPQLLCHPRTAPGWGVFTVEGESVRHGLLDGAPYHGWVSLPCGCGAPQVQSLATWASMTFVKTGGSCANEWLNPLDREELHYYRISAQRNPDESPRTGEIRAGTQTFLAYQNGRGFGLNPGGTSVEIPPTTKSFTLTVRWTGSTNPPTGIVTEDPYPNHAVQTLAATTTDAWLHVKRSSEGESFLRDGPSTILRYPLPDGIAVRADPNETGQLRAGVVRITVGISVINVRVLQRPGRMGVFDGSAALPPSGTRFRSEVSATTLQPRIGAVADGVTHLLLRVPVAATPTTVALELPETGGSSGLHLGSLKELGSTFSSLGARDRLTLLPKEGQPTQLILYKTPEFGASADGRVPTDEDRAHRLAGLAERNVRIRLWGEWGTTASDIVLRRPPVLLLHGFWSEPDAWKVFTELLKPKVGPVIFTMADLPNSAAPLFSSTIHQSIRAGIYDARTRLRNEGFAVTQFDVVAKSTGGVNARTWVANDPHDATTYNAGDFHKLITLDAPHCGSFLADFMGQFRQALGEAQRSRFDRVMELFRKPVTGTLPDLETSSGPLRAIPAVSVPSHVAVGAPLANGPPQGEIAKVLEFFSAALSSNEPNDGVVTAASQAFGFSSEASLSHAYWHHRSWAVSDAEVVDNAPAVAERVAKLLDLPPASAGGLFATGFPSGDTCPVRSSLTAVPSSSVSGERMPSATTTGLSFTSPLPAALVAPGSDLHVSMAGNQIPFERVLVLSSAGAPAVVTAPFATTITIPEKMIGPLEILAVGRTAAGEYHTASVEVIVQPPAALAFHRVLPEAFAFEAPGATEQLRVIGTFMDGLERDITSGAVGTSYASSDASVASVTSDGVVTANAFGTATVTATSGTFSKSMQVTVGDSTPTCPVITLPEVVLPAGVVDTPFLTTTITATAVDASATFAVFNGVLPPGLTLSTSGVLSGTPTHAGTYEFTIRVIDPNNCNASRDYSIVVHPTPVVTASPVMLRFTAMVSGTGAWTTTPPQRVTVVPLGYGASSMQWTVSTDESWLTIAQPSGVGAGTFTATLTHAAQALPVASVWNATVTITSAGVAPRHIPVVLQVIHAVQSLPPIGVVDTPLDLQADVSGSLAVTGWAVDDVGIAAVRICRRPVGGEHPMANANCGNRAEVFIGTATLVPGARPDVAAQFSHFPDSDRAGWGYLLLTNFLPDGGDGTYVLTFYAYAVDGEFVELPPRTITCTNATSTTPFGAIDTPDQGAIVSGTVLNFGWVLAPGLRRADPPGGGRVAVYVDGLPVGSPGGWTSRQDLTEQFAPGAFSGLPFALGVFVLDTTRLTNGVHTIAWVVTDDHGTAAGVGSRYFTVANAGPSAVIRRH